jgi:hypothetical protein
MVEGLIETKYSLEEAAKRFNIKKYLDFNKN